MHQLQNFNFKGNNVRAVIVNDNLWWIARDVCSVLDITNTTDAIKRLDDDEVARFNLGRQGYVNIINEPGLYSLILGSRKEEAREFKRWVTHEVLPSIRKTGSYVDKPKTQAELMVMYAKQFVEMESRVEQVESKVTTIHETFLHHDEDWRNMVNGLMKGASYRLGGNYRDLRAQSYQMLEERGRCDLNTRLRNLKARMSEAGHTKTAINNTSRMDVIEADPRLKEIYTTIVKELSIGSLEVVR